MVARGSSKHFQAIQKPKLLVVEGEGDKRFFYALLSHMDIQDIEVRELGGKSGIRKGFVVLTKMSSFAIVQKVVIVRDADTNPIGTFQSISSTFSNAGLAVPDKPYQLTKSVPSTMGIILPDENINGELEDLCLSSVSEDPAIECVEQFMNCIDSTLDVKPKNLSKSKIHAFLSTRENPELQIGEAADAGHWNFENPIYDKLKTAIKSL